MSTSGIIACIVFLSPEGDRMRVCVRKFWEDQSGQLGSAFHIDSYVGGVREDIMRRTRAHYTKLFGDGAGGGVLLGHLLGDRLNGHPGAPRWKRGQKKQPVQDAGLTRLAKTPVPGEDAGQPAGQRQQSRAATGASHPATGGRPQRLWGL